MEIISHRGYWLQNSDKNSLDAFDRSFSMGFGTETDFRDKNGQLVISHDPAVEENSISTSEFLEVYNKSTPKLMLAINIKANGLESLIREFLIEGDKEASGIWLDAFEDVWYTEEVIKKHIDNNKKVAIVSSELARRNHLGHWEKIKNWDIVKSPNLILCTDFPEEAQKFFFD